MSKRWPWPCINCGHPDYDHVLTDPTLVFGNPVTKAAHLKCPFAATRFKGYTALEFVIKMATANLNDYDFFWCYQARLTAALGELERAIRYPKYDYDDLLWMKAIE